jgi:hypothetical protein
MKRVLPVLPVLRAPFGDACSSVHVDDRIGVVRIESQVNML